MCIVWRSVRAKGLSWFGVRKQWGVQCLAQGHFDAGKMVFSICITHTIRAALSMNWGGVLFLFIYLFVKHFALLFVYVPCRISQVWLMNSYWFVALYIHMWITLGFKLPGATWGEVTVSDTHFPKNSTQRSCLYPENIYSNNKQLTFRK